jgi:NitT/TauT family transport system substrate-binding protein
MTPSRRDFLRKSFAAALAATAGGVVLGACGDDDDDAASGTTAVTTAPTSSTSGSGASTTSTTAARQVQQLTALMPFPLFLTFIADVTSVSGGFQEAEGVDLELQFGQSAPQALQQLAAGNVPITINGPLTIVRAVSQEEAPFVAIATEMQETIYRLVSTPSSKIEALAGLEGATVGFPSLGGNAEDVFNLVSRDAGLDPEDVNRVAVGNDAASLAFLDDGRVDVIFGTLEAATGMATGGAQLNIAKVPNANPLLGFSLVVQRETIESRREVLVGYLAAMHKTVTALLDPDQRPELLTKVRADWELPQLDDPARANPVIDALLSLWLAAGEENLMRNVPERWEDGVARFVESGIAKPGSTATDFYTNELVDEALV